MTETRDVEDSPDRAPDSDRSSSRTRDGLNLVDQVLRVFAALLAVATAWLGFAAASATSERDALDTRVDRLTAELDTMTADRNQLARSLEAASERIRELEQQSGGEDATPDTENPSPPNEGGDQTNPSTATETALTDLDAVGSEGWDVSRALNIDGQQYAEGVVSDRLGYCGSNASRYEQTIEYSIGRRYSRFVAAAGLSEESAPDLPLTLEVIGDGQPLWSETLVVGSPADIDVDVTDVLRLRLEATIDFDRTSGCQLLYAALGEPTLEP